MTEALSCRRWSFGILMYELLYGFTPFRGAKRDATFENILKRPLAFPTSPEISADCQVCACFCAGRNHVEECSHLFVLCRQKLLIMICSFGKPKLASAVPLSSCACIICHLW